MEACWSFKSLVGSSCGFDAKDRKRQNQIVPLLVSCSKDISGPQNEIDRRVVLQDGGKHQVNDRLPSPSRDLRNKLDKRWRYKVQSSTGYFRT